MTDDLRSRINSIAPPELAGPMPVIASPMFALKVRELKAVCEKNPKNPKAVQFTKATAGLADDVEVTVEKADLEAVLDNKDVEVIEDRTDDGRRRLTKKLVPLRDDKESSPKKEPNIYNAPPKNPG